MNILPKKSWHVGTRKNIERVRRDEAEAERRNKIEQDRILVAEREARQRSLGIRRGQMTGASASGHINLFEAPEEHMGTTNRDHEDERLKEESRWQQKTGILKKLVRDEDRDQPWYCRPRAESNAQRTQRPINRDIKPDSGAITSIYDPLITMKHADEIIRSRRADESSPEIVEVVTKPRIKAPSIDRREGIKKHKHHKSHRHHRHRSSNRARS